MADGDIFREVEEEIRREQYAKLWDKYGYLILGAAVAIVAMVAGYKYWTYQQVEQSQTFGARFMDALNLANGGKRDLAQLSLQQIADKGPRGYAMLAKMREAAMNAKNGKMAEAINEYDKLADDGAVDPVFRDFSRIQAAMLRVDDADEAEMQKRLGTLAASNSSWRHSARELLGLAAYKAGNTKSAENYYNQLLSDRTAPAGIRQRAEMMLSLIVEASAEKGKAAPPASASSGKNGDAAQKTSSDEKQPAKKAP